MQKPVFFVQVIPFQSNTSVTYPHDTRQHIQWHWMEFDARGVAHFLFCFQRPHAAQSLFVGIFITLSMSNRFPQLERGYRTNMTFGCDSKVYIQLIYRDSTDTNGNHVSLQHQCIQHLKYPRGNRSAFQGQANCCFHSPSLCPQMVRLINKICSLLSVYFPPS